MSDNDALVFLRLFGALRDAVGHKEVQVPCAGGSVSEVLLCFAEQHGDPVRSFIFDGEGKPRRSMILLLNGDPIGDSQTARVEEGDVVSLLLPLAGG
jgi:molybdopterin converting factor small subunit